MDNDSGDDETDELRELGCMSSTKSAVDLI